MRRFRVLSLLLLVAAAPHAPAQVPALAAQREAEDRARAAEAEERRLAGQRVAAAARLRDAETEAAEAAATVDALAARHRDAASRLADRAAALTPLLPLIERLALYPAETMLAVPAPPQDTLRGLAVLRGLARQLEAEAAALRTEQTQVDALSHEVEAALPRLRTAQAAQAAHALDLDGQIAVARAGRLRLEDAAADAARRAAADAARADSLRTALAAMEAERVRTAARARDDLARAEHGRQDAAVSAARQRQAALARPAGPGMAEGRVPAMAPVAGTILRGWGERTEAGPANGVSYRAPPLARVVAPCAGRVAFAGPFRSFGVMLILDCGGGFHFVLAGLDRLDVAVGTAVQVGEPVGVMPGWDPQGGGARPALYLELRRDGLPVNPAPFLRARG